MNKMFSWRALSKGCAKGFLIALNLMAVLNGVCIFGFAVVDTKILQQYGEEHAAGSVRGNMAIIGISVFVVCVGTFGVVAAMLENVKMLNIYVTHTLALLIIELMIAIFVSVQRYGLQFKISEWLREDFFSNVTEAGQDHHEKLWDRLQTSYKCCGLNSPQDYAAINRPISLSCCERAYRARTSTAQVNMYRVCVASASYYPTGCEDEILDVLKSDADWLFGVAIFSFWFESVSVLLAMCVVNHVENSVTVYKNTVKY